MARIFASVAVVIAVSTGCGANTATEERVRAPVPEAAAGSESPAVIRFPENPIDRSIRRDLNAALAQDTELKHRDISFTVVNGDVNVMGIVRSEAERQKLNELALNIGGVKSVANGLRVAE